MGALRFYISFHASLENLVYSLKLQFHKNPSFIKILLNTIPLITTLPQVESFDTMDDSDVICIRGDYEGFWIDNKSSM